MEKWGLALAGGGTRGVYHLGVWQALRELGVEIGGVVGTSIGSVNAALFVQNDFDKALDLWRNITVDDVLGFDHDVISGNNLFDYKNLLPLVQETIRKNGLQTMPFQRTLESVIDEDKIRNSGLDYGLNTTSVSDIESVDFFIEDIPKGQLVDCIMASACFPGFQRRYIADKMYADGGIMNNMPLNMLVNRDYKNIIAVDVGGVGLVKSMNQFDTNIIYIRCTKPLLGILQFEAEAIEATMKQAYYDTYKVFGRLTGKKYYFNTVDYFKAKSRYSDEILSGLETAAEAFGIEQIAVYRVDSLIKGVVQKYEALRSKDSMAEHTLDALLKIRTDNLSVIMKLVDMILNHKADGLNNRLLMGVLGSRLAAANAIAYFLTQGRCPCTPQAFKKA